MKAIRIAVIALLATSSLADFSTAQTAVRALPQPVLASVGVAVGVHTGGMDLFYSNLAPYGQWVQRPSYGWSWAPRRVATHWRPYTRGHWVYTDYGWTWVSAEPWAWATYHYGRWKFDPDYGWLWVPGTNWGPGWVAWKEGGGYTGWAPLPPEVGFDASTGLSSANFDLNVDIAPTYYSFCPERQFLAADLSTVIVPWDRNVEIIRNTRDITRFEVVNNQVIDRSLAPEQIERVVGRPVPRFPVVTADSPAQVGIRGDRVAIYRPAIVNRNVDPSQQVLRQSARFAHTPPPTVGQRAAVLAAVAGGAAIAAHHAHLATALPGQTVQTRPQQRQAAAQAGRAQRQNAAVQRNGQPMTPRQQRQAATLAQRQNTAQRNGQAVTPRQQRQQQRQAAAVAQRQNTAQRNGQSMTPRQQRQAAAQRQAAVQRNQRTPAGQRNSVAASPRQRQSGAPGSSQRQVAGPRQPRQTSAQRNPQPPGMRQQSHPQASPPPRQQARSQARQVQAPPPPRRYQARPQQALPPARVRQQQAPPPRAQAQAQPRPQPRAQAQPRPPQRQRQHPNNPPPPPGNG